MSSSPLVRPIYLDHNATTRPDPRARAAAAAALDETFANPSSTHGFGRAARDLVETSRAQVAALLCARSDEIVFTSGGTEANHLAIRGAARALRTRTGRAAIVSSPLEHPSVLGSLDALAAEGFTIRLVPPDSCGRTDLDSVRRVLGDDVALVSFAAANHELGNLADVAALAALAHTHGALFHSDAVQAAGRIPLDASALGIDLCTLSSHKLYGPKGAGAVYQRRGVALAPLLVGGHQEKERRPGTENVPGIAGFGVACAIARAQLESDGPRIAALRDRLEAGAFKIPGARRFGCDPRVPGTANLGFDGVDGELLMIALDLEGIAVSTGAACSSGSIEPSRVIRALGVSLPVARQATRFSLGRDTSVEEIDEVLAILPSLVERIRQVEAAAI